MTAALELRDVRAGYGRIEVLHGVSIDVPEGAVVALLGRNGMGKTTTLRAISGTIGCTAGTIRLDGRRIDNRRPSTIAARGLVLVPEGRGVFPGLSVRDNLAIAHRSGGAAAGPLEGFLATVTEAFPVLGQRLDQSAGLLSGGEQQMLAISRALAGDPSVLMFDELSMGLAPIIVEQLMDRVAKLRAEGRTIVLVEQYLTHALKLADLCYVLAKGRVEWVGEPGELKHMPAAASYLTA
ncbi:MAG TPA: ABC transporter ATP-binding protein [Acidimicrobiales bacterium]|nr:ABC transporter ATP-binding protein [Acidimicrobiales bacterium]